MLESLTPTSERIALEKLEISVDITAKGEIRLIASGGMETKGAIKFTFTRR